MTRSVSLVGAGSIPTPTVYAFPHLEQSDPNGRLYAGHQAVHDFATAVETADSFALTDEVANLVDGGDPAVCSGIFGAGQTAAKGLKFTTGTSGEVFDLPDVFDLLNLGSEPSFVLALWVKQLAYDDATATRGVAGYARFTTTYCQWSLSTRYSTGNYTRFRIGRVNSDKGHDYGPLTLNTATLLTVVVRRTGSGTYTAQFLKGANIVAEYSGTYPFVNPLDDGTATTPRIGAPSGYNADLSVVVHKANLFRIDPDNFDAEYWATQDIALNYDRFA